MLVDGMLTRTRVFKELCGPSLSLFQSRSNTLLLGKTLQTTNLKILFETQAKTSRAMATSEAGKHSNANSSEDDLMKEMCNLALNSMDVSTKRDHPVVDFKTPKELGSLVDFNIDGKAKDNNTIKDLCKLAIKYSVKTAHPRFFNQQYGGISKYGVGADVVATSVNANAHTFEVAPFFVMTEKAVLAKAREIFGYEGGDGTFCPGGSYSCMLAMNLAKFKKCPDVKSKGLFANPPMVLFVSAQGHYSALKNAMLLGLGTKNCIQVACDDKGKIIPSQLEKEILKSKEKGAIPFFVIATAGTTVLGSFDPFHEVAEVCKKYDLWMHVDGCWGGSAMLSNRHKHLCDGINSGDSISWNPHKMLMIPHQCSLLLLKEEGLLKKYNTSEAPYIFQPEKPYDTDYDIGSKLIQCGRRVDSFKLWVAWKANGDSGFEKQVDRAIGNAQYFLQQVKKRENFRLVIPEPEYTNVSFWYIPASLRNQKEDKSFWEKLHLVAPTIKTRMQKSGSMLIGYQPLGTIVNFFRIVIVNSAVTHEDLDFVLDEIERLGKDL